MILGIAKKNALERLSVKFSVVFFGNVDMSLASENADKSDIGFVATPGLLGSYILVKRARRRDVV